MNKRYVCIDLEMSELDAKQRKTFEDIKLRNEIIQIGAVMLDEKFNLISRFDYLVKPQFSSVSPMIEKITGISNRMLEKAESFNQIYQKYIEWLDLENNEVKSYCWSPSDYRQLCKEITLKSPGNPQFHNSLRNYVDLQRVFSAVLKTKITVSVESALKLLLLDFTGTAHNAECDAENTAVILQKLCSSPDYIKTCFPAYRLSTEIDNEFDTLQAKIHKKKYKSAKILTKHLSSIQISDFVPEKLMAYFDYKLPEKFDYRHLDPVTLEQIRKAEVECLKASSMAEYINAEEIRDLCAKYYINVTDWINFTRIILNIS